VGFIGLFQVSGWVLLGWVQLHQPWLCAYVCSIVQPLSTCNVECVPSHKQDVR